jgi:hypothetical protein
MIPLAVGPCEENLREDINKHRDMISTNIRGYAASIDLDGWVGSGQV